MLDWCHDPDMFRCGSFQLRAPGAPRQPALQAGLPNPPQAASLPHTCKGSAMPSNLEMGLYVFMLATFVGLEVIRRVSPCCTRR